MTSVAEAIDQLVSDLSLEDKVLLLTGRDFWNTVALPQIGLRNMLLSDGPSGVRGERWDEREPSLNLPSSTSLASTWNRETAKRYGQALASEARRKGVDVVLGPTINLHRSPFGGRHFECMSEDPVLTGALAAAYVDGIQGQGVAATPKHYVANDFETDRFNVDVVVDERTLHELYLRPFEQTVVDSDAWSVMSAYNSINGATATENDLLQDPLRSEWGFSGVVISDWTAVRTVHSATKEQDLVMPGPAGPWGDALVAAVQNGEVAEAAIDRKVARLLLLAARVGALDIDGIEPIAAAPLAEAHKFAFDAAIEGSVLLRNEANILPMSVDGSTSVALIGHNAKQARTQGGGSATVLPASISAPLEALTELFGPDNVRYSAGAVVQEGVAELPLDVMTNPATGEPGLRVRFLSEDGTELFREDRRASALVYFGGDAPIGASSLVEFTTRLTFDTDQKINLGFAGVLPTRLSLDGKTVLDETLVPVGDDLGAAFLSPPSATATVQITAGVPVELRITLDSSKNVGPLSNALSFTFGIAPDTSDPEGLIQDAVDAASQQDVAIVVVGTNTQVESEGFDRDSLDLPGHQDRLVQAVVAANPNTIVIVNSGSPVLMPWRNDVAAVLLTYFPGQQFGEALAAMLSGVAEPGGRLPTTWPANQDDLPVWNVTPKDGKVIYEEGLHIGYRAWLKANTEPAYAFGYGLSYTTWSLINASAAAEVTAGEDTVVEVTVTNTGERTGKQIVQVYAERADSTIERPTKWLVGFTPVTLQAGQSQTVLVQINGREFAHWDQDWKWEPGTFTLSVGTSVSDVVDRMDMTVV